MDVFKISKAYKATGDQVQCEISLQTKLKCLQVSDSAVLNCALGPTVKGGATVVQEVDKSFSNQKVGSSIPCQSVLEQDTEPLIAPDVQCAISVNV